MPTILSFTLLALLTLCVFTARTAGALFDLTNPAASVPEFRWSARKFAANFLGLAVSLVSFVLLHNAL